VCRSGHSLVGTVMLLIALAIAYAYYRGCETGRAATPEAVTAGT